MTRRTDEMLDHEFDGIREFDNPPPGWIMWIFYVTILVAVGYWLYYHTFPFGKLPTQAYEAEMAAAAQAQLERMAGRPVTDDSLKLVAAIPARVTEGRAVFEQFCVVCHGPNGEGNVGPNLTDGFWLHGGSPLKIDATVTNGVLAKGMAAWGSQLGPTRVQSVVAYVLSIKNTDRPGKPPQGDPEPPEAPPAPAQAPAAGSPK